MKNKSPHIPIILAIFSITILLFGIKLYQYKSIFKSAPIENDNTSEALSFIPLYAEDPILGNKKAPLSIIAFEDFLCEGCRIQHTYLKQLVEEYPDKVHIIWKDLPIHEVPAPSQIIHEYAFCANEQDAFAAFSSELFLNYITTEAQLQDLVEQLSLKQSKIDKCLASGRPEQHIEKNKQIARALNIQSAPTFFINDTQITTPQSYVAWKNLLSL